MKRYIKPLTAMAALTLVASAYGGAATVNWILRDSFVDFPFVASDGNVLGLQTIGTASSGATLAGRQPQGLPASGSIIGEIFYWTAPQSSLSAILFDTTGWGASSGYQLFMFDLGTKIYNAGSSHFNPSAQWDMFNTVGGLTFDLTGAGSTADNFMEVNTPDIDMETGHSYAVGFVVPNGANLTLGRASGYQSDPNGDGFTAAGLTATDDNASPWSGSPRNLFIGVYVPEPGTMALMGLGAVLGMFVIRRRRNG